MNRILRGIISVTIVLLILFSLWIPTKTMQPWVVDVHGKIIPIFYLVFAGLSALLALCACALPRTYPLKHDGFLAFLVIVWLMSCLGAPDRMVSLRALSGWMVKGVIAAWVLLRAVQTQRQALWIARLLTFAIGVVAVVGLIEFMNNGTSFIPRIYPMGSRIMSTVGHPLPLAALFVCGMLISLGVFATSVRLTIAVEMMLGVALAVTFSRSSWAIALLMIVIAWRQEQEWRYRLKRILAATTILCSLTLLVFLATSSQSRAAQVRKSIAERFSIQGIVSANQPVHHRMASYITCWRIVKQHPFLGIGIGSFAPVYDKYMAPGSAKDIPTPDNMVLRLWAETGFIGLAAWIFVMWAWLNSTRQRLQDATSTERPLRYALFLAAIALWLNSFFFDSFYWNPTMTSLAIVMALCAGHWTSEEVVRDAPINLRP